MRNQMQQAFANIQNPPPYISEVLKRIEKNRKPSKGWDTKLSFRTYQKLKSEGKLD